MRLRPISRLVSLVVIAGLALVVVAIVLRLTGLGARVWPIAPATAFTLYLVPLSIALAGIAAVNRQWPIAATLAACAVVVVAVGLPRARAAEQPTAAGPKVRVMSANLLFGKVDADALARLVDRRQPDVLALQELSTPTLRRLRAAGVFDELPYVVRRDGSIWNDTGIASRWPLKRVDVPGLPSVYVVADATLPDGRKLRVVSAHPTPPVSPAGQRRWQHWLASVPEPGALRRGIIAGDFNATVDHAQFRGILDRGWRDVADSLGDGLTPTWDNARRFFPITIDHVLIPPGTAARAYAVDELAGSDHQAITATVVLPEISAR